MKRKTVLLLAALLTLCLIALVGCQPAVEDPGAPPESVINIEAEAPPVDASVDNAQPADTAIPAQPELETEPAQQPVDDDATGAGAVLENVVTVRIGQDGETDYAIDMYDNAAVMTMLDYLTGSALLFPTYTYSEDEGFVGQDIRGNYTRDDEVTIPDVHAGELYLFSGGQLRFYFKDVPGANITATPVGYAQDAAAASAEIPVAYEDNQGDTWGVDVYFWITKNT